MKVVFGKAEDPRIFYKVRWESDVQVLLIENAGIWTIYVPGFEYHRAKTEILGDIHVEELSDIEEVLSGLTNVEVPRDFPIGIAELFTQSPKIIPTVHPQRKIKTIDEIHCIEQAQKIAIQTIALVEKELTQAVLREGRLWKENEPLTSEYLKSVARAFLMSRGYDCPNMIIASGAQTSLPHHRGEGQIREGPVIVDIFPRSDITHYHGDMTRTIIIGEDKYAQELLSAVKEVHSECIKMCIPGASVSDIHQYALDELEKRGFETTDEKGFTHSLGHGVGLDIHEAPNLSLRNDVELEENMVVTIEPGLYYDIGVRHEDIVIVRKEPVVMRI